MREVDKRIDMLEITAAVNLVLNQRRSNAFVVMIATYPLLQLNEASKLTRDVYKPL